MREVTSSPDTINRVVERLQQGVEREANFRPVFQTYYRPLLRFFEKRGFPTDEAHDLTQETLIRVYNSIGTFRREAPFEAWLFQIAANLYRNKLRERGAQKRAGRHLSLVEAMGEESPHAKDEALVADKTATDPLDGVLREERVRLLRGAIASLPEQMRRCVMLRVYQDLSYGEIATVMRLSVETVKSHLHQARQQLKAKIGAHYGAPEL